MNPEDQKPESGHPEDELEHLHAHLETLQASLTLDPQLAADLNVLAAKRGSRR